MTRKVVVICVLLVCCALLAIWLSENLIRQPTYTDAGYKNEARRNNLYAVERLLSRMGVSAASISDLAELPDMLGDDDTLLLMMSSHGLAAKRRHELLDWVETGGHLLLTVYQEYSPDSAGDQIFDYLRIGGYAVVSRPELPFEIESDNVDMLRIAPSSDYYLSDQEGYADMALYHGDDAFLLQYQWGLGQITVVNDFSMFFNTRIDAYDHADFLWRLLALEQRAGKIWLQYVPRTPSLLQLIWQHAWMLVLSLAVTLSCVIWGYGVRVGPMLMLRDETARSLLEHIQASGRFLWRHGAQDVLLAAVRQRVLFKLKRHPGHWQQLDRDQQLDHLAEIADLPKAQLQELLAQRSGASDREFFRTLRLLQDIDKKL